MSAAQMHLLTAKLPSKDLSALKKAMLRPGFVAEWNHLDSQASGFAKVLLSKQNAKASASYKLFMSYDPEAILWLGFISKDKAVQERFNLFLKVWPEARPRIPYVLMQEMRITPELPGYAELVQSIFLELIDGHLTTPEEMRAYLEPHSPPAPPPQVTIKRSRAKRAEAKIKEQVFDEEEEGEEGLLSDEDTEPIGDDEELDLSVLPKGALVVDEGDEADSDEDEEEAGEKPAAPAGKKKPQAAPPAKKGPAKVETPAVPAKPAPPQPVAKGKPAVAPAPVKPAPAPVKPAPAPVKPAPAPVKPAPAPAKPAPAKAHPALAAKAKPAAAKTVKPAKPAAKKSASAKAKAPAKAAPKKTSKSAPKSKPAAKKAAKPAAKKPAPKGARKR
jgi:hypothetical protein